MKNHMTWLAGLGLVAVLGGGCGEAADDQAGLDDGADDSFLADGKSDAFGIDDLSYEAAAILELHSTLSREELRAAGIGAAAAEAVVARRAELGRRFGSLAELDAVRFTGRGFFERSLVHVTEHGLVGACGDQRWQPPVEHCDLGIDDGSDACTDTCRWERRGYFPHRELPLGGFVYGDKRSFPGNLLHDWHFTVTEPVRLGLDLGADWGKGVVADWLQQRVKSVHHGTFNDRWWTDSELLGGFISIDWADSEKVDPRVGVKDTDPVGGDAAWDLIVEFEPGDHVIQVWVSAYVESTVAYSLFVQPL